MALDEWVAGEVQHRCISYVRGAGGRKIEIDGLNRSLKAIARRTLILRTFYASERLLKTVALQQSSIALLFGEKLQSCTSCAVMMDECLVELILFLSVKGRRPSQGALHLRVIYAGG